MRPYTGRLKGAKMKKVLFPLLFVLVFGLAACEGGEGEGGEGEGEDDGNVPATESYLAGSATFNLL